VDLTSAANAQAAFTATGGAVSAITQQQGSMQTEAIGMDSADREAAVQQFSADRFLESQHQGDAQDMVDAKINAAITAYTRHNEDSTKRQGILQLLG
jgi:hypothetical protein